MENEFFLNPTGISQSLMHFDSNPSMASWHHQFSSPMDVPPQPLLPQLNHCSSSHQSPPDCFLNPVPDQSFQFDSALTSMVSSPAASNSNLTSESFVIRELIGKLGGNSERRILEMNSTAALTPSSSSVAEFSSDPGFAERAARFSCFGSRSFNGRQLTNEFGNYRSNLSIANEKLSRVSSSPSLKVLGSETNLQEHKNNSSSPEDESSLSNPDKTISNTRKRKAITKPKQKEPVVEASPEKESPKKLKAVETKEIEKGNVKTEEDLKKTDENLAEEKRTKANSKPPEAPKDYIHVRARRGQATDSHSLAERVRREKISERMKLLQDLVPGCNKVTGKALMLDEIINYVQSLQHQVEFLSMKLASVNTTRVDFNMDSLISKQMYQSGTSLTHPQISPIDSSASSFYGHQSSSLPTTSHCSVDPLDSVLCQNLPIQIPPLNSFLQNHSQYQNFGEDELQSIVQMGFIQNQTQDISLQSHNFNLGSDQMKIEL